MKEENIVQDLLAKDFHPKNVYFVACGGSLLAQYPAFYLIQREGKGIDAQLITSNEFVHATPKALDENSIAVFCSLSGTPETMVATEVAKNAGAVTIAYCYDPNADMSKIADYHVPFNTIFNPETKYMESNAAPILKLAFEILAAFDGYEYLNDANAAFDMLQDVVNEVVRYIEPRAQEFARLHKDDKIIVPLAGGPALGVGYGFSICSLMEMQWVHAPLINTGEFFHGPFEIVDRTTPFVLFMSDGRNRSNDERAKKFLDEYADRVTVLDAKELYINQFPASVCEFFNHFVFDAAQRRLLSALGDIRKHDLMTRRYMWHVEY